MAIKNMPHFDDIDTGEDESKKRSLPKNPSMNFVFPNLEGMQNFSTTWTNIPGFEELMKEINNIPMDSLSDALSSNDQDLANKLDNIIDQFTPEAKIALDSVMNMLDNGLDNTNKLQELEESNKELKNIFENFLNDLEKLSNKSMNQSSSENSSLNDIQQLIDEDNEDELSSTFEDSAEDDDSILLSDSNDEEEDKESDTSEKSIEEVPTEQKILTDKAQNILNTKEIPYSLPSISFLMKQLDYVLPDISYEMEESKFPLSLLAPIIPEEYKDMLNVYDACSLLDEHLTNETLSLTCMAFVEDLKSRDDYYLPLYFTIYNDGQKFSIYVHKEHNPIDENNHILSMHDLIEDNIYNEILKSENSPTEKDAYRNLYNLLDMCNFTQNDPKLKNVLLNINEYPISTINELGTFHSNPTQYTGEKGLFNIGYIDLDDSLEVKYFLSDYDLKTSNNQLKVYGLFSHNSNLSKKQIAQIESTFSSSFVETNETFKKYVSLVPYYDNIVIIKFCDL